MCSKATSDKIMTKLCEFIEKRVGISNQIIINELSERIKRDKKLSKKEFNMDEQDIQDIVFRSSNPVHPVYPVRKPLAQIYSVKIRAIRV